MRVDIVARNFELPDASREAITTQIARLGDIGPRMVEATLLLEERHNQYLAEVTLFGRRVSFHAETQVDADAISTAVDAVLEKAQRQMRRHKERMEGRRRGRAEPAASESNSEAVAGTAADGDVVIVPMPDNFEAKPMSVEEAAMQLRLSSNAFVVFRNAESHEVNVLFKKRNGTFGWIFP
jgi:putative sigma-54 modulation protein